MDALFPFYKDLAVSRGFKYHYYFSPAASGKQTLLFLHGFPSLAADWYYQILYFKEKGYGIVAPDMLGYGGTDKPEDTASYAHTLLARDLVDILEHEKVGEAIAIGHDWGSKTVSVLANLYADRFIGFAFLSVGYNPPNTERTYDEFLAMTAQVLGYESVGYWEFFSAPDANKVITEHIESFWDVLHAKDHQVWKDVMCPTGAIRAFIESDSRTDRATYFPEELFTLHKEGVKKHGLNGPLNYYRAVVHGVDLEDGKKIPLQTYTVTKPVYFGGTAKDPICVPAFAQAVLARLCPNATAEVFPTGHWVMVEAHEDLNDSLNKWISTIAS